MSPNYVTVTLDVYDGSGNRADSGFAYLTPSAFLTDTVDHQLITEAPVTGIFSNGATPVVSLLATDNANITPSGWKWAVSFSVNPPVPGNPANFSFFLPTGPANFTATNASPCVFTWTPTAALASLPNDTGIKLAGSPPAGFAVGTTYYVINSSGSTFKLAAAPGGPALNSSSTGSGTLTVVSTYLSSLHG